MTKKQTNVNKMTNKTQQEMHFFIYENKSKRDLTVRRSCQISRLCVLIFLSS
jgi:hypothetical protein